jgi:hypothetical protein
LVDSVAAEIYNTKRRTSQDNGPTRNKRIDKGKAPMRNDSTTSANPYPLPYANDPIPVPGPVGAQNNVPVINPAHVPTAPVNPGQEPPQTRTVKKTRGKARRLPVKIARSKIWDKLIDSDTGLSFAEWVAIDNDVQKDLIDGIRYLRENKRKRSAATRQGSNNITPPNAMNIDHVNSSNMVNAVGHYVEDGYSRSDNEENEENSFYDSSVYFSDRETDVTADSVADLSDFESVDEESVYGYPYDLTQMRNTSPLKGMISINGCAVEAVFDSGASVSVIGKRLADKLGLVPSDDELPLVGFNGSEKVTQSKIIMSVPIMIAGRLLRPEHMCLKSTGNDSLCLLGVPWLQSYGITIDICNSRIVVPTSKGNVTLQCYTRHLSNTPVYKQPDTMAPVDVKTDAATKGSARKQNTYLNECYLINAGNSQNERYEEDLVPDESEENEKPIVFTEENIAADVPGELSHIIEDNKHVFSEVSGLGRVRNYQCNLELLPNAVPVKSRPYRMSWEERDLLKGHLDELLALDVIEPSDGSWTSPTFFIDKRDGTKRLVQDYRRLNKVIKPDFYPLPLVEDLMNTVCGSRYFSALDCASGYYQLPINPEHRELTGFTTCLGVFRFKCLPFGCAPAVGVFQRMMNTILKPYINNFAVIFLDDVLVYSKTMEEHARHLQLIFEACTEWNLRLKRKKSVFGKTEVEYLGHSITGNSIKPCARNVEKIKNMAVPTNSAEVRTVLGLTGYYQKFCQNYSHIAAPLTDLTKKGVKFKWGPEQQAAFDYFIDYLTQAPVLALADRSKKQILSVDASSRALCAILSQASDVKDLSDEEVISYASRKLKGAELNYSATELESLALVWGVNHFAHYLRGRSFIAITDHASLKYIFQPKKTTPKLNRWAASLLNFTFEVRYRKGSNNPADCLSRMHAKDDSEVSD